MCFKVRLKVGKKSPARIVLRGDNKVVDFLGWSILFRPINMYSQIKGVN